MKHNPGFLQLVEQAKRRVKECGAGRREGSSRPRRAVSFYRYSGRS